MFYLQSVFNKQCSNPAQTNQKCHYQLQDRIYHIYGYNKIALCSSMIFLHCKMTTQIFERDVKRKSAKILGSEIAFNCPVCIVILRSLKYNSARLHQRLYEYCARITIYCREIQERKVLKSGTFYWKIRRRQNLTITARNMSTEFYNMQHKYAKNINLITAVCFTDLLYYLLVQISLFRGTKIRDTFLWRITYSIFKVSPV